MLPKQIVYKEARVAFMGKQRIFNRSLDKIAAKFRGFNTINADCIIPTDDMTFASNRINCLSQTGWFRYWNQVDDLVRKLDRFTGDARAIIEAKKSKNKAVREINHGWNWKQKQKKQWKNKSCKWRHFNQYY